MIYDLIKKDIKNILGFALPTFQFVAQAAGPAFWQYSTEYTPNNLNKIIQIS